jgi:hypothetical protein
LKLLWEKLKAIGINLPKLSDITGIKFSSLINIKIDRSIKTTIEGSTLVIDPHRLTPRQQHGLRQFLRSAALDEAGVILDENSTPTVNAALEALPGIEATAQKFLPIILPKDIPLLRACLFLRARFDSGVPVEDLKMQIVHVYGPRGAHFANLCSAGYLEEWFWPLYEGLLTAYPDDPEKAKAKFQLVYNNIVTDLPWTEFVSSAAAAATVTTHICDKMRRNIQNGVNYLNVHGLGKKNVKKVIRILPDIQNQTGAIATHMDQDATRIFVRLEMPRQISG